MKYRKWDPKNHVTPKHCLGIISLIV